MKKAWTFLKQLWALTAPYFKSEEKWKALSLLGVIIGLNLFLVYLTVVQNSWYRRFYDALEQRDQPAFWSEILFFSGLAAIFISVAVLQLALNLKLQINWREWLTKRYLGEWMEARSYYRLQLADYGTDNPDQRIAEDLREFVSSTLGLTLGLMNSVVSFVSFAGILWTLSGNFPLGIAGYEFQVPGSMLWVAVIYCLVGSLITHFIGRPLVSLNFRQEKVEANFRYDLVRFRENAEGVALYAGERSEQKHLLGRFGDIHDNWNAIIRRRMKLQTFVSGFNQAVVVFPFLMGVGQLFSGAIQLGGLMQIVSAFGRVQDALSWFVDAYTALASWTANIQRLTSFRAAIDRAKALSEDVIHDAADAGSTDFKVEDLALSLPDGTPLLNASFRLKAGEDALITGPSGSGKSTLFRAIAGIWPFGKGHIHMPASLPSQRVLFLPQKPYVPVGTLRAAVTYPALEGSIDDATLRRALADASLSGLVDQLDEEDNWQMRLSGGELQRLAVARALAQKPHWLFLDEATSAMDEGMERDLYAILKERLPDTTIISIGHRSSLKAFHQREINLATTGDGVSTIAAE
ncbi:ABC transporter ATP-binding protein/permease [Oleomonas cavernae]|uniref:ABC transporter ATP-binding protein/permease n=1 Tax=Oleomonas cavernae TaxID=2320859 RepID=A0A418WDB3_9PROT|nr:ABC transporter ATP-binding protein/permease [Oleomonas cavernae]RJF88025.1 ABC transporter ATP-binding protein/permease [Oleomonas cavernae]